MSHLKCVYLTENWRADSSDDAIHMEELQIHNLSKSLKTDDEAKEESDVEYKVQSTVDAARDMLAEEVFGSGKRKHHPNTLYSLPHF